jgi:hypothetical protein
MLAVGRWQMRKRTVFISYSSKDRKFAERLAAELRASGAGVQ